jgi:hypothetical protein
MFSIDPYILEFVGGNWLAIGLAVVLLNGLCEIIPGELDDKIVSILKRMVTFTRQSLPKK